MYISQHPKRTEKKERKKRWPMICWNQTLITVPSTTQDSTTGRSDRKLGRKETQTTVHFISQRSTTWQSDRKLGRKETQITVHFISQRSTTRRSDRKLQRKKRKEREKKKKKRQGLDLIAELSEYGKLHCTVSLWSTLLGPNSGLSFLTGRGVGQ